MRDISLQQATSSSHFHKRYLFLHYKSGLGLSPPCHHFLTCQYGDQNTSCSRSKPQGASPLPKARDFCPWGHVEGKRRKGRECS